MQLSFYFACGSRSDENKIKDFHLGTLLLANGITRIFLWTSFIQNLINPYMLFAIHFSTSLLGVGEGGGEETPKSLEAVVFIFSCVHYCLHM